jgi:metal-responsive CopG/Arc/MetJ family transcriptional regulator
LIIRSLDLIPLSKDVLIRIDRLAGSKQSRSAFIEPVLRGYLQKRARRGGIPCALKIALDLY